MFQERQAGIYQVKLPLPLRLDHVNCYALQGEQGWSIIDAGLNTEQSRATWLEFMADRHITPREIKGIYLTHFHPDHFGAAGWLQNLSGAPVYMSMQDAGAAKWYWVEAKEAGNVKRLFAEQGMPQNLLDGVVRSMEKMLFYTRPCPQLSIIYPQQTMQLGEHAYQIILTPGHSDGHVCFYNAAQGLLFSGDHLLAKITPNISYGLESGPDPLKNYLTSIAENGKLDCRLVLPAHGQAFHDLPERIRQLETHHADRLEVMSEFAACGVTAYEVCRQAFKPDLSFHELRFAMAETLAHLVFLVNRGELQRENCAGIYRYQAMQS